MSDYHHSLRRGAAGHPDSSESLPADEGLPPDEGLRADPDGGPPSESAYAGFQREDLLRYARHFVLPHVGPEGQRALADARVLLVGAGGLGSPVAMYLAAAGVGT